MGFFSRFWLALRCFFRILFNPAFASRVATLRAPLPTPAPKERPTLPATPMALGADRLARNEQALHLLSMLQREGRLIDFCEEEVAGFGDAQIGAAARAVHAGCRKALRGAFAFAPIRTEPEGTVITLPNAFDPRAVRLTGNVLGNPPFTGMLRHHGWRVTEIKMPAVSGDPTVVAPAEVELP